MFRFLKGLIWMVILLMVSNVIARSLETLNQRHGPTRVCVVYQSDEPYHFIQENEGVRAYKGLSTDILKAILVKGTRLERRHLDWSEGLEALKSGECHVMMGAFDTKDRESYAYFSKPYRFEIDKFYHRVDEAPEESDVLAFLEHAGSKGKKLGVINKAIYTSDVLNDYISAHPEQFVFVDADNELIQLMLDEKIQGFFGEQTKMELFLWRSGFHDQIIASNLELGSRSVHFMFSKKLATDSFMKWFNQRLEAFKGTIKYDNVIRQYRVPIFIAMTTDTFAYHCLELLGTMFYAISGLLLAKQARFSFTGAFILAMLPGIGGGLMRDIMLNRDPVGILRTPIYFLTVVATAVFFYLFIRARIHIKSLHKISDFFHEHMFVKEFSLVRATDAFGLAAFTIIGVMVAVEVQANPLWLWGPVISVLSSTGGGIVRDFFLGRELNRTFFYETSFVWSLFLTLYIIFRTQTMTSTEIFYAVTITFCGIICTRIMCLKYGFLTKDFWLEEK